MKKTGKDALLAWAKQKTNDYPGVEVANFSGSWRDGLAMCALIHSLRPSLIPWETLKKADEIGNLNIAFAAAERLGVPKLLDAEDMSPGPPEPLSVITYLGTIYHASLKLDSSGGASSGSTSSAMQTSAAKPASNETTNVNNSASSAARPVSAAPSTTAKVSSTPPATTASRAQSAHPATTGIHQSAARDAPDTQVATPQLNGTTCVKCGKVASGVMVDWSSSLYHQECFKCAGCNKAFKKTCLDIEGFPYCETCGRKAFVQSRLIKNGLAPVDSLPGVSSYANRKSGLLASPASSAASSTAATHSSKTASDQPSTPTRSPTVSSASASSNATPASLAPSSPARSPATSVSQSTTASSSQQTAKSTSSTQSVARSPVTSVSDPKSSSLTSSSSPSITTTQQPTSSAPTGSSTPTTSITVAVEEKSTSKTSAAANNGAGRPYAQSTAPKATAASTATRSHAQSTNVAPAALASTSSSSSTSSAVQNKDSVTAKSSSSATAKPTASLTTSSAPTLASNAARSPQAVPPKESIIEKEMREQREREAELQAARDKAKATPVKPSASVTASTSTPSTTPSNSTASSPHQTASTPTTNASASTNVDSKPAAIVRPPSPSIAPSPASSTTTPSHSTSSQSTKQETIVEREMREMREREEELAAQRAARASSVAKPAASTTTAALAAKTTASTSNTSQATPLTAIARDTPHRPSTSPAFAANRTTHSPSSAPAHVPATQESGSSISQQTHTAQAQHVEAPSGESKAEPSTLAKKSDDPGASASPTTSPAASTATTTESTAVPHTTHSTTTSKPISEPKPAVEQQPQPVSDESAQSAPGSASSSHTAHSPISDSSTATSQELPFMPPAPSRQVTIKPGELVAEEPLELADAGDASKHGEDDEEVTQAIKRHTTILRRVDVDKVEAGHNGWLKRRDRTAAIKLFWTPLWFSLKDFRLLYYKDAQVRNSLASEHPPEGFLSLQFIDSIRPNDKNPRKFIVEGPSVKWDMKASTKEEAVEWVDAMNDAITMYNLTERNKRTSKPVFGQDHAEDLIMEGSLDRQTTFGWQHNWWLLQDGMLFYFAHQGGKRLGRIPLYHCEFAPHEIGKEEAIRAFCITSYQNEKIVLAAKDDMEMHRWLNCMLRQRIIIEEAIDMISF